MGRIPKIYTQDDYNRVSLKKIHNGMKNRCNSPANPNYKNYGKRGIKVCDEWLGENGFENFMKWALSNGFQDGLSIERIDVNKDYCPNNCTFIPLIEQNYNKTNTIYIDGKSFAKAVKEAGVVDYRVAYTRFFILGWSFEDSISKPKRKIKSKYDNFTK